jgi:hypothetical protein
MVILIPAPDRVLRGRSPIVGVPSEAEATALTIARMQQEIDATYDQTAQAVKSLIFLSGAAVSALIDRLEHSLLPGIARLSDDLFAASRAFHRYAEEVAQIHAQAEATLERVSQDLREIDVASHELREAGEVLQANRVNVPAHWSEPPSFWPPISAELWSTITPTLTTARVRAAATWSAAAVTWRRAIDRIHDSQGHWSSLITQRQEAEQRLGAALHCTELGALLARTGLPRRSAITRTYTGGLVHTSRWQADPLLSQILSGRLTVQEVSELWQRSDLSDTDLAQLPIGTLIQLANTNGIDVVTQNAAARAALDYAIEHPAAAYRSLSLAPADISLATFTQQVRDLRAALAGTDAMAVTMSSQPAVQLLNFGVHDGAVTAAISLGDLGRADSVAINVSGMGSEVGSIGVATQAARHLYAETIRADPSVRPAVVTWIGYRSPAAPPSSEVLRSARAASGATSLAHFIDGVAVARAATDDPPQRMVVLAHSYGSTVAAEALKFTTTGEIDAFVAYGSAGFSSETQTAHLRARYVYATMAKGDQIAEIGRVFSARRDPNEIDGVRQFSSEGDASRLRVTMHGMYAEAGEWSLANWTKTGYLSEGTASVETMGVLIARDLP